MLNDSTAGACFIDVVVSRTLCSTETPGGAGGTVILFSGTLSGVNVDCSRVSVVVVNGTASSDNTV